MELALILAAFGGGLFGAAIGGTISFIFTGLMALVGIAINLSIGDASFLNTVAFGPFFGPHIAFVGGVAAAAYAGLKKCEGAELNEYTIDGADCATPLFAIKDPMILLVGGVFGVLGLLINNMLINTGIAIDTIATTVVIMGIASRLLIGKQGLFGAYPSGEKKFDFSPRYIVYTALWGFGLAAVTSYAALAINVNSIGWAISAVSLLFLFTKANNFVVSHHVTMVAGYIAFATGSVLVGAVSGAVSSMAGEYINRWTNTHVKSHLDMPAIVIALGSFVALTLLN